MAEKLVMPKLGMTMTEGNIEEWHKEEGETVKVGDPVLTISSDKLTQEVEATIDGVLLKQVVPVGGSAEVGATIAILGNPGEDVASLMNEEEVSEPIIEDSGKEEPSPQVEETITQRGDSKRIFISPLARKMAEEEGLDIQYIKGTGGNDRITKRDILRVIAQGYDYEPEVRTPIKVEEEIGKGLSGMRAAIARNMMESLSTTAQLTLHRKARANELLQLQEELRRELQEEEVDVRLTLTVLIARATVLALQEFKKINATYHEGQLVEYDEVHLGIATSLEDGLLVPVIKHAEQKTLGALAKEIRRVSTLARDGEADGDLLAGSTFTITNMGAAGIEYFTPILNKPEVGILGVGAIQEKLVLNRLKEVEIEKQIPFSLTFDHQILDGADGAEFLSILVKYIESPTLILL